MSTPPDPKDRIANHIAREHARMLQCRCRNNGTCLLMNTRLGWPHGMPIDECDVCWSLGGEKTPEAQQFRELHAAACIGAFTKSALEGTVKPPREILVALTVHHQTIDEERFKAPDIQNAVKAPITWVHVEPTWKKAASFLRAVGSKLLDVLPERDRDKRQQSCFGETLAGERVGPPCQMLREINGNYFCGACGCGENALAILGSAVGKGIGEPSKLSYPHLECPLRKDGFANARVL